LIGANSTGRDDADRPASRSNVGVLRTRALLQADVGPRVRGNKIFIPGGITTSADSERPGPCA
jgi:hypothetical protein